MSKRKRQQEPESEEEDEIIERDESEEEESPKASQKTKKRKDKNNSEAEDGKNLEAGIIEEIKLKNFMCHPNFKVDFHDRTTIIHGENGSGKSAILTAIQVGLGSKARNTNRGNSIKDLVMSGKEQAEIVIKLRNQGKDAYKKELYGKSIIIAKNISKTGNTTLKIQNSQGKTISKSSKELAIILHSFNIQIENPTTCMTQDISREFLAGSSEAKKYQFFLRATQLQDMNDNIARANKNIKTMQDMYDDKLSAFQESTDELKRREELYKDTQKIDGLREEMTAVQSERLWAMYHRLNLVFEREARARDDIKSVLDQLIEKRESSTGAKISELQAKKTKVDQDIEGVASKLYLLNQEASNLLSKRRDIETRHKSIQQVKQKYNKEITGHEQEIQLFEKNKNETLSKNKTDKDSAIKSKQEEIDKIQEEMDRLEENKKKLEEESSGIKVNREKLTTQQNQSKQERNGIEEDIRRLQDEEHRLKQSRTDKFAMVGGQSMKTFLNELAKSKNFSKPPIGPLGLLLTVKEEHLDWASAIEQTLNKNLNGFIVDNFKDGEELNRIKTKCGVKFTHIIQQYANNVYDLSRVLPQDYITIYHTLDVDLNALKSTPLKYDDTEALRSTLINMLINQSRIEKTVLIEDTRQAQSFIDNNPQYEAVTMTGTRIFRKGGSSVTDVANAPRSKLWTKSVEEEIQARVKSIDELRKKAKEVEATERRFKSEADRLYETAAKLNDGIRTSARKIDSLKVTISKKKRDIDEIANEEDNDQQFIEELEAKIKVCQEKITISREKLKEEEKKIEELKVELNECNQQASESKVKLVEAQKEKEHFDREAVHILQQIDHESRVKSTIDNEINQYQIKLRQKETALDEAKKLVDESYKSAVDRCEFIQTSANPENLRLKIEAIKKAIQREEEKLGQVNASDVKKDYLDYKRTYEEKKEHLDVCAQTLSMEKEGVKARTKTMEDIHSSCVTLVSQFFGMYMSQKGHSGQIEVDDGNLKFIIHMATHGTKVTINDARSLSGGEKSFTTVSFLLSIWELVETPFRAVDEFDVFMDNMYRKTAMDLILSTAKAKHSTRQLIIITPQDVSIVDKDPDYVKIIKLKAPQRDENQRTMEEFIHNHQM